MESLTELYKIGPGPSSSHTIGPKKIVEKIRELYPEANRFKVILYGSLSLTGKGHLTDYIIKETFRPFEVEIIFSKEELTYHPNGLEVYIYQNNQEIDKKTAFSIGGGAICFDDDEENDKSKETYPHDSLSEIYCYIENEKLDLYDYALLFEEDNFYDYMETIFNTMNDCVHRGLNDSGVIPGKLGLIKVGKDLHKLAINEVDLIEKERLFITSFAYCVSEQNASGGIIVTAPTCGASGVIPAIMYYCFKHLNYSKDEIIKALIVGGIFGNIIKRNATISGAQGGCQAEIGTACSMAAAGYAYLKGLSLSQIEYAAEMGIEHFLGLTCDPIGGYVQIPCIERNAFGALRALNCVSFAKNLGSLRSHRVSFDSMVEVMKRTGEDLKVDYRETSIGGLAKQYPINIGED